MTQQDRNQPKPDDANVSSDDNMKPKTPGREQQQQGQGKQGQQDDQSGRKTGQQGQQGQPGTDQQPSDQQGGQKQR